MVSPCSVSFTGCFAVSGGSGSVTPLPPRTCPSPGEAVRCTVRTLFVEVPLAAFGSSPPWRFATWPRCEEVCCCCCCDCAIAAIPAHEQPRTAAHTATLRAFPVILRPAEIPLAWLFHKEIPQEQPLNGPRQYRKCLSPIQPSPVPF